MISFKKFLKLNEEEGKPDDNFAAAKAKAISIWVNNANKGNSGQNKTAADAPDGIKKAQNKSELMQAISSWQNSDNDIYKNGYNQIKKILEPTQKPEDDNKEKINKTKNDLKNFLDNYNKENTENPINIDLDKIEDEKALLDSIKDWENSDNELFKNKFNEIKKSLDSKPIPKPESKPESKPNDKKEKTEKEDDKKLEKDLEDEFSHLSEPYKSKAIKTRMEAIKNRKKLRDETRQKYIKKAEGALSFSKALSGLLKAIFGEKADTSALDNAAEKRTKNAEIIKKMSENSDEIQDKIEDQYENLKIFKEAEKENYKSTYENKLKEIEFQEKPELIEYKENYKKKIKTIISDTKKEIENKINTTDDPDECERLQNVLNTYNDLSKKHPLNPDEQILLSKAENDLGINDKLKEIENDYKERMKTAEKENEEYREKLKKEAEEKYNYRISKIDDAYKERENKLKQLNTDCKNFIKNIEKEIKKFGSDFLDKDEINKKIIDFDNEILNLSDVDENILNSLKQEQENEENEKKKKQELNDLKKTLEKYEGVPDNVKSASDPQVIKDWIAKQKAQNESYKLFKKRKKLYESKIDRNYKKLLKNYL